MHAKKLFSILIIALVLCAFSNPAAAAPSSEINSSWKSNGPLFNIEGTPPYSRLQNTTLGLTLVGASVSKATGYRLADDLTVPAGITSHIEKIKFYAYQTGLSTTSPITNANLRIWDGMPGKAGSNVIWGDTTTNIMTSTAWTGGYRDTDTEPWAHARPIMEVVVSVNIDLPEGTYWLDWQIGGSSEFSGPWAPPITITGTAVTGNARQYLTQWEDLVDHGASAAQGIPFEILSGIATHTVLTTTANPSAYNTSVTFTATVSSGTGIPTGSVTFKDGESLLGSATLDAEGKATFTTSTLLPGPHVISVDYNGDDSFSSSQDKITQWIHQYFNYIPKVSH